MEPEKIELFTKANEDTKTVIEWSEFHYHLFSHLISDECPRKLAQNVELACFLTKPTPDSDMLDLCVKACIESDGPEELNKELEELVQIAKMCHPEFLWKR